jgi:hypothetical protein
MKATFDPFRCLESGEQKQQSERLACALMESESLFLQRMGLILFRQGYQFFFSQVLILKLTELA